MLASRRRRWAVMTDAAANLRGEPAAAGPVLVVDALKKHFPLRRGFLTKPDLVFAVDGVSFAIGSGETLGLVGESGCGKSTVGRAILRLIEPTAGTIRVAGQDITTLSNSAMRPFRRELQIIFQ